MNESTNSLANWEDIETLDRLMDSKKPSVEKFIGNFDDLLTFLQNNGCAGLPNKKAHMLEIGSGKGRFIMRMKKEGFDIIGVDRNTKNVDGSPRAPKEAGVIAANAEDLRATAGEHAALFNDQTFDIVFADHSFAPGEYTQDVYAMAHEVHRVLKDGGFFVTVFNKIPPPQLQFPSLANTWLFKTIDNQQILVLRK